MPLARSVVSLALLTAVLTAGLARADPLEDLRGHLRRGEVASIDVLEIPPDLDTFTNVTPERLERAYFYRLSIQAVVRPRHADRILESLQKVIPRTTGILDVRWGLVLYTEKRERLGAVYLDRSGNASLGGQEGTHSAKALLALLAGTYGGCFRD